MWLVLNDSFLSVVSPSVADKKLFGASGDVLMVRAREEGDIERVFPDARVHSMPGRDYPLRAFLSRAQVAAAIADRVIRIDYSNFKDSVKSDWRHDIYSSIWAAARRLETTRALAVDRARDYISPLIRTRKKPAAKRVSAV